MPVITGRLKPNTFRLPVEKIRAGYKSDIYFSRTQQILLAENRHPRVTMQVFQKVPRAIVCGVDQALAILAIGTGYYMNQGMARKLFEEYLELEQRAYDLWRNLRSVSWRKYVSVSHELFNVSKELDQLWYNRFLDLEVEALFDGEEVGERETVMLIRGDLATFVHLETLYLGALTDGTMVATNARDLVEAAEGKPVLMFGARHQASESQAGSGYAAYVGGVQTVSTSEQGEWWGSKAFGTMPHALIAAYNGNTLLATVAFAGNYLPEVNVVSLVDFDNDSVRTSFEVARALQHNLYGVRLDTSENMVDVAVMREIMEGRRPADGKITGVTPRLVELVREALNREGFNHIKISVSGGFNPTKIKLFQKLGVPVDSYGVGSTFFDRRDGKFEYTADVVEPVAKRGRGLRSNPRLHAVNLEELLK